MIVLYKVWRTNRFNGVPSEFVCSLDDFEVAKGIIEYQATLGDTFAILKDDVIIYD